MHVATLTAAYRRPRRWAAVAAAAAGVLAVAPPLVNAALSPVVSAGTVNWSGAVTARLQADAYGLNVSSSDPNMTDPAAVRLMKALHIGLLRYPGGSLSDTYNWETGSILPSGFRAFAKELKAIGARGLITANYGTGSTALAAAWVKYAKKIGAPIAYWEIGNEVYGNGFYPGWDWEADYHSNHSPSFYGQESQLYIRAMRRENPTLDAGLAFVYPWGSEPARPSGNVNWDQVLLSTVKHRIGFIDMHDYPAGPTTTDQQLLSLADAVPATMRTVKANLRAILGPGKLPTTIIGELNSNANAPGPQSISAAGGLFLIQNYLAFLANGASSVAWWDLHGNTPYVANVQPGQVVQTNYGDFGLLSSGQSPEPAVDTPFLTYWAFRMMTDAIPPGDQLVRATALTPSVWAMGFRNPENGIRGLLVVNVTPGETVSVRLANAGGATGPGRIERFGPKGLQAWTTWAGGTVTLGAYSAVAVEFRP